MAKRNANIHEFEMELTPYSFNRLYGQEKYSLQNMVLKMVNYPAKNDTTQDQHFSIYMDRAYHPWLAAAQMVESQASGDAWMAGLADADFLKFASKLFAILNTRGVGEYSNRFEQRYKELYDSIALSGMWRDQEEHHREFLDLSIKTDEWARNQAASEIEPLPLTGALCIRMTNVSSGYPCPVVLGVIQKSNLPRYSGNSAPFIKYPRSSFDPTGMPFDRRYLLAEEDRW